MISKIKRTIASLDRTATSQKETINISNPQPLGISSVCDSFETQAENSNVLTDKQNEIERQKERIRSLQDKLEASNESSFFNAVKSFFGIDSETSPDQQNQTVLSDYAKAGQASSEMADRFTSLVDELKKHHG